MSAASDFFERNFPDEVSENSLTHSAAAAMARLLSSGAYSGALLRECRRARDQAHASELLIVEVEVALGQRATKNDIHSVEPVAIVYERPDRLPLVYPLREGFPSEIPHFNVAGRGVPRSLCLFDMEPEEALRLATPLILIERVRIWMRDTAYGRLHGENQPLDPVFLGAFSQLILPRAAEKGGDAYVGIRRKDRDDAPVILRPWTGSSRGEAPPLAALMIETQPLPHGRLREVPVNVAELIEAYSELGVDLVPLLKKSVRVWFSKPSRNELAESGCLAVVRTAVERVPGQVGRQATKAFLAGWKVSDLAEHLGIRHTAEGFSAPLIVEQPPNMDRLRELAFVPMDVRSPFDRTMAQAASGLVGAPENPVRILLVGAGALGSQVALTAARMGLGLWSVVDADYLLPHNIARHALSHRHVALPKADALAMEICDLLGSDAASSHVARIEELAPEVCSPHELVLDASASVPVARWLASVSAHPGRTCSLFLNPAGTDLLLLVEGEDRIPRLDHVEMSYYWALASGAVREDHLSNGKVGLFPSGGCRRASLAISQADIGSLAPLAVKRLLQYPLPSHGLIEILAPTSGSRAVFSCQAADYSEVDLDGWTVAVSGEVLDGIVADRVAAGALETGGILVGTWDRIRRRVYVVGRYDPPPDSVAGPLSFVRGSEGVYRTLEAVQRLTAGNLTYIGEWHTHPVGHASHPSADDRTLLKWIGDVLVFSDVPPLMLVAGVDGVRVLMGPGNETCLVPPVGPRAPRAQVPA